MRIYLASSWRSERQPAVLKTLRRAGHLVYDFRNPAPGNTGFAWSDVEPDWLDWDAERFRDSLHHPIAAEGFKRDMDALRECDACVLLLPCGRSAHIEAGWAAGAGKRVLVLLEGYNEPELMYLMTDAVVATNDLLLDALSEEGRSSRYDTPAYRSRLAHHGLTDREVG